MPPKKNNAAKISILVLSLSLLFICLKYFKKSDDFNKYKESSNLEQKVLKSQLDEILHKYDSVTLKIRVDSLKFVEQLKIVQSGKYAKNEVLGAFLEDAISREHQTNKKPNVVVSKSSLFASMPNLNALNINAKGVKIYSDSFKVSEVPIQQLRVCFTLEENQLINSGNKKIYVQIVNPKNQIISSGDMSVESESNVKLQYSAAVNANYLKKDTDVCTYVDLEKNKTIKGKYRINIYHDFVKIGTTIFEY